MHKLPDSVKDIGKFTTPRSIDDDVGHNAYVYLRNLFPEVKVFSDRKKALKDNRTSSRMLLFEHDGEGFGLPDPLQALLEDLDRNETPLTDQAHTLVFHIRLSMRCARTNIPEAQEGTMYRHIVNFGFPATVTLRYPSKVFRVHFPKGNVDGTHKHGYFSLGAVNIRGANPKLYVPGGNVCKIPTLASSIQENANDQSVGKVLRYERITVALDILSDAKADKDLEAAAEKIIAAKDISVQNGSGKDFRRAAKAINESTQGLNDYMKKTTGLGAREFLAEALSAAKDADTNEDERGSVSD